MDEHPDAPVAPALDGIGRNLRPAYRNATWRRSIGIVRNGWRWTQSGANSSPLQSVTESWTAHWLFGQAESYSRQLCLCLSRWPNLAPLLPTKRIRRDDYGCSGPKHRLQRLAKALGDVPPASKFGLRMRLGALTRHIQAQPSPRAIRGSAEDESDRIPGSHLPLCSTKPN